MKIFESLKFRDFRYLLFSLFFAMFGFHIQMTVRGILVYDITNNPLLTGIVSAGFAPSLLLFAMFGGVIGEKFDKRIFIQTIDFLWRSHIQYLEHLRQVVELRGYAAKDPLQEFNREAFSLFESLLYKIKIDLGVLDSQRRRIQQVLTCFLGCERF